MSDFGGTVAGCFRGTEENDEEKSDDAEDSETHGDEGYEAAEGRAFLFGHRRGQARRGLSPRQV